MPSAPKGKALKSVQLRMSDDLDKAYRLLARFKSGRIKLGRGVTPKDLKLVRNLVDDLIPGYAMPRRIDAEAFAKLIVKLSLQNTLWNKKLMQAMVLAEDAKKSGRSSEGLGLLDDFINKCPSSWYRRHAQAARRDLQRGGSKMV